MTLSDVLMYKSEDMEQVKTRYRIIVNFKTVTGRLIPRNWRTVVAWLTDSEMQSLSLAFLALKSAGIEIEVEKS